MVKRYEIGQYGGFKSSTKTWPFAEEQHERTIKVTFYADWRQSILLETKEFKDLGIEDQDYVLSTCTEPERKAILAYLEWLSKSHPTPDPGVSEVAVASGGLEVVDGLVEFPEAS